MLCIIYMISDIIKHDELPSSSQSKESPTLLLNSTTKSPNVVGAIVKTRSYYETMSYYHGKDLYSIDSDYSAEEGEIVDTPMVKSKRRHEEELSNSISEKRSKNESSNHKGKVFIYYIKKLLILVIIFLKYIT